MDNRKIIASVYLATSMLVWFVSRSSFQYIYLKFYQVRRLPYVGSLRDVLPVLFGVIVFAVLFKHAKVNSFMDEVVVELKKVSWPSREDIKKATLVVIICIFIASFILAAFDVVWGNVIGFLMKG